MAHIHIHTHATGLPLPRDSPHVEATRVHSQSGARHGSAEHGNAHADMDVWSAPPSGASTRAHTPRGRRAESAGGKRARDERPPSPESLEPEPTVLPGIAKRLLSCENFISKLDNWAKDMTTKLQELDERVTRGGNELNSHLEAYLLRDQILDSRVRDLEQHKEESSRPPL